MSPASYQTAPPRVAMESGKRDSNPRPQPWQGCALPTELFPRAVGQSNRSVGFFVPPPPPPPPPTPPRPPRPPRPRGRGGSDPPPPESPFRGPPPELRPPYYGPPQTPPGRDTAPSLDGRAGA